MNMIVACIDIISNQCMEHIIMRHSSQESFRSYSRRYRTTVLGTAARRSRSHCFNLDALVAAASSLCAQHLCQGTVKNLATSLEQALQERFQRHRSVQNSTDGPVQLLTMLVRCTARPVLLHLLRNAGRDRLAHPAPADHMRAWKTRLHLQKSA
ncbi:hypothetical protein WJX73_010912 [Symbiochloris irregularis]|uniref:Uncharacterized protein n=1 Tax=Symbiochloris irregularis TaxID=706552 RepID=A0AAW1NMQ8_9CHLO